MNLIFKYNGNAKSSTRDLKIEYTGNDFSVLDVYLNVKGPSAKIKLLNIFKNNHIGACSVPTAVGYDKWEISNSIWKRFYYGHNKYRPELSD